MAVAVTCRSVTLSELRKLKATRTPEGQAALALAESIDSKRSLMAQPAMVKALRDTLDALRDRTPKAEDGVDEFSKRRADRLARRSAAEGQ